MGERPFETERTRNWRSRELDAQDQRAVSNIEEYGCHILQVRADGAGPGWSYTVGAFDTRAKAEVIVMGLKEPTAQSALNEAVRRLQDGVDLTVGRLRDIVGEVECVFRPVDPKWLPQLMGWDGWYYGAWDFPVLQCIYPDLQNRFQDEPEFQEYFRQPLLQADVTWTQTERDFWAANDLKSSLSDWRFPDGPHTLAFLSQAVHSGREPITYVSHDAVDGAWQFHGPSMSENLPPALVCLHHLVDQDASLNELADLPPGWFAERSASGQPWTRHLAEDFEE